VKGLQRKERWGCQFTAGFLSLYLILIAFIFVIGLIK